MTTDSFTQDRGAGAGSAPSTHPGDLCDLVMKGGITSGVIYPKLVSRLAEKYGFKNIGGTSAGAIAAGASAAAEFGRLHDKLDAFAELDKLPGVLSAKTQPSGRSKLFSLFQPAPALRRHFEVLVAALNKTPAAAVRGMVRSLLLMHPVLLVLGVLVGSLLLLPAVLALAPASTALAWTVSAAALVVVALVAALASRLGVVGGLLLLISTPALLAWLFRCLVDAPWSWRLAGVSAVVDVLALVVVAVLVLLVLFRFAATLLAGLHSNGYGLCSGRTASWSPKNVPGLTDWLTGYLNELAGLPADGKPLTFGQLWGTDDYKEPRAINLEVMTSAITQKMIYSIPFRDGTPRFFYDPDAWSALFPDSVMDWLDKAVAAAPQGDSDEPPLPGTTVVNSAGKELKPLPRRADLPVVVAVRMSLSFPILLSAVPLHTVDWSRKANQDKKKQQEAAFKANGGQPVPSAYEAAKVWFSDGGIGSNLPLHMFDALLPGHPTFAVNLKAEHPDFPIKTPAVPGNSGGRVYLPLDNRGGHLRYTPPPQDARPASGLVSFLLSIVETMQNWRDEIMFPYPGFRDRLVQISQRPTEGGLNLDMPAESILALSNAGKMAADRLVDRFHPSGVEGGKGWRNHQTVRLGTFLGVMQPGSCALEPLLSQGVWAARIADIAAYDAAEVALANKFLRGLSTLAALGAHGVSLEDGALRPLAQIRITPRI